MVHEAPHRMRGVGQQARIEQRLPQHGGIQARQQRQAFARQAAIGQDRVIQLRQPFDGGLLAIRGSMCAATRRRARRRGAALPAPARRDTAGPPPNRAGACASGSPGCDAAFERAARTHRVGQFGDHALVDDRAVRGRRHADGVQLRAGGRVVVVNRADQRLRGAAQQIDLQIARDRQAACGRQHGTHPDLRAQRVGIARGVDVAHQRRGVGAQLTQRLFELGVAALDDARDFDVGGDLVVVDQRQLELAALVRRARARRSALPSVCSCSDDTARRTKSSRWACNTRRASAALAESHRRPIAPLLQHGVDDRGEGRLGQPQFLVDELR